MSCEAQRVNQSHLTERKDRMRMTDGARDNKKKMLIKLFETQVEKVTEHAA